MQRSIIIPNAFAGKIGALALVHLLSLVGVTGNEPVFVGWWRDFAQTSAAQLRTLLGEPWGAVCVKESTDLDWVLWRSTVPRVACAAEEVRLPHGCLFPAVDDPPWVLTSGVENFSRLYPGRL